jgi:hypothetical protein
MLPAEVVISPGSAGADPQEAISRMPGFIAGKPPFLLKIAVEKRIIICENHSFNLAPAFSIT